MTASEANRARASRKQARGSKARQRWLPALAALALVLGGSGAAAARTLTAGSAAAAAGAGWGRAVEVPGLAGLNAGGKAEVLSVSCVSGGFCAAGGYYTDHGKDTRGFLATGRAGHWNAAREVPGLAALNSGGDDAQVSTVSCAAGGYFDGVAVCQDCGGGPYTQNSQGFVVTERGGRWGDAQVPPGLAALNTGQNAAITSISCPSAGDRKS